MVSSRLNREIVRDEEESRSESMVYESWLVRNPDSDRTVEDELMGRIDAAFREYNNSTDIILDSVIRLHRTYQGESFNIRIQRI